MKYLIISFLLISPSLLCADVNSVQIELSKAFNKSDYKPWIATTLIMVDWVQTRYIATHDEYEELNPLLGRNPTLEEVNRHFIIVLGIHYLVNKTKYKNPWNRGFILAETFVVARNRYLGVGVKF